MKAKQAAHFGLLTATALILGYLEQLVPIAPGLPGVKLGLGNLVLLYSLYAYSIRETVVLMVLKVLLCSLLFSGPVALLYSLAGGILSLMAMVLLKRISGFSIIGVSAVGAVFHNLGQLGVAALIVGPLAALSYLPILMLSAIITGVLTGFIAGSVLKARNLFEPSNRK